MEEAKHTASSGKRGPYEQYSLTLRAEIGKYACHHGVTAPVAASQISWLTWQPQMHQSLPYSSMFSPRLKLLWKANSAKILLCENFSSEPFVTWKFPNIRYVKCVVFQGSRLGLLVACKKGCCSFCRCKKATCWCEATGERNDSCITIFSHHVSQLN